MNRFVEERCRDGIGIIPSSVPARVDEKSMLSGSSVPSIIQSDSIELVRCHH